MRHPSLPSVGHAASISEPSAASFREKGSKALGFTMASFVLARAEKVIESA